MVSFLDVDHTMLLNPPGVDWQVQRLCHVRLSTRTSEVNLYAVRSTKEKYQCVVLRESIVLQPYEP